jgi:hypothetical protein
MIPGPPVAGTAFEGRAALVAVGTGVAVGAGCRVGVGPTVGGSVPLPGAGVAVAGAVALVLD